MKQQFYESLTADTEYNEDVFKKIYGYAYTDPEFLERVAGKLTLILGKPEVVQQYNEWLAGYQKERAQRMKPVAEWFCKENEKRYDELCRKAVKEWEQKRNYLQRKKERLQ